MGETAVIGKRAGADQQRSKATWPALFGLQDAQRRCDDLLQSAMRNLEQFGAAAAPLRQLASFIVERSH
jgi:geranylgeranyl pyrophosphate synthase